MRSKFKWILTLLLAFSLQLSFAQEKTVTGVVSDAQGPIPGANVVVKGTQRGVQTDMDGKYSITAKQGDVLVFSFVGMEDYQATVGASNQINATLQEGLQISEVIVGALGIKRIKDQVVASQQVVKTAELTQAANPNGVLALVGKVSGLTINTTNNGVQANTRVVLRGNRSITGNNQALFVIDNVISTAAVYSAMPPEMIESVNVVKGPQGAALYGSQGVNGVIIVTTKRGSAKGGKVTVDVSSSVDFEDVIAYPQRQRRYGQGWSGTHVAYENGAWGAEFDGVVRPVGLMQADGTYIMAPYSSIKDNIKEFFDMGTIYQNSFSVNAGDAEGYASFSASRLDREFVVKGDIIKRNTFIFKGGKTVGKWSVDGNVQYISNRTENTDSNLYSELLQSATNIPIDRFESGRNEYHWNSYYTSPYWTRDNIRNATRYDYIAAQATLNYKINDHIDVNYVGSIRLTQTGTRSHTNEYIDLLKVGGGDLTTLSRFDAGTSKDRQYYGDLMVNFNYDLTDKINFKANVGHNLQDGLFESSGVGGNNLTIPGFYHISNVTGIPDAANSMSRVRRSGLFANIDLAYDDYLYVNLTGRNDWTSVLDEDNQSFFYPSAGISFIPTKAFDGLENNDVLNYAKISTSFVRNGNTNVAIYQINQNYGQAFGYPFGTLNSFVQPASVTSPDITPEFYTTYDVTANLEFFKSRLTVDASAYITKGTDLNTNITPSFASGLNQTLVNLADTTTKGFEIDLGFTPIDNKDLGLKWTNRLGFSTNKTVVDKLINSESGEVALANFTTSGGIGVFAEVGEEFPLIKGVGYERDSEGRVIIDPSTGNPVQTNEYIKLGVANPDYILNYSTSVEFKGFTLAAVMDYRHGGEFWSGTKQWLSWSGHLYDSALTGRTGFIFPNSSIPDPNNPGEYIANNNVVTGGSSYGTYLSYFQDEFAETAENFILDATAFKVRELSLSYSFKKDMVERMGLSALRLGVNARNPFMVLPTQNRDYSDPETSRSTGNDQGIAAVGQYPLTRTFGFTVNVTF